MDNDSKIIDIKSRRKKLDDNIDMNGFEDWDDDYKLISKGDYIGLKRHRQEVAKSHPAVWR